MKQMYILKSVSFMNVTILKDPCPHEKRVAITPQIVKKLLINGATNINIEASAGEQAGYHDAEYKEAGASIIENRSATLKQTDIVLCVNYPLKETLTELKPHACVVGIAQATHNPHIIECAQENKLSLFAMEKLPRITRAQSMDVLSSQSNLAGYRAVIEAAYLYDRVFPMMMTAAGTVPPARVIVIGTGVAGLQAIATAKRLGCVVSAFDVRTAAKEQVESLGATFIEVEAAKAEDDTSGYAQEVTSQYKERQAEKLLQELKKTNIVITTALIPGKPAPKIITSAMVKNMPKGSIIVDLAAPMGGNCELTQLGDTPLQAAHGIKVYGPHNILSHVAYEASQLYAKNLLAFMTLLTNKETQAVDYSLKDELVAGTLLVNKGEIVQAQ